MLQYHRSSLYAVLPFLPGRAGYRSSSVLRSPYLFSLILLYKLLRIFLTSRCGSHVLSGLLHILRYWLVPEDLRLQVRMRSSCIFGKYNFCCCVVFIQKPSEHVSLMDHGVFYCHWCCVAFIYCWISVYAVEKQRLTVFSCLDCFF